MMRKIIMIIIGGGENRKLSQKTQINAIREKFINFTGIVGYLTFLEIGGNRQYASLA